MKWVGLAILLSAIWPVLYLLKNKPERSLYLCFLIGILPFISKWLHLLVAPISWRWVGYTQGLEIFVIDIISIISLIRLRGQLIFSPFIVPLALYLVANVIATFDAAVPMAGVFYCWQLVRVILLYLAVANLIAAEPEAVSAILKGLAFGEIVEFVIVIYQRLGQHILQTPGTLASQNELGLATHFVLFPFFAILLGGRRGWLPVSAVIASLVTDIFTTSRGAVALAMLGIAILIVVSTLIKPSARKLGIIVSGLALLAILAPLAVSSFGARFAHGNLGLQEDAERLAFKRAAQMIWAEHPGGVGPNNFALVANIGGYYRRAGKGISAGGLTTNVHNAYLLILAEAGPAGLGCFLLMMVTPILFAFRYGAFAGRSSADDPRKDILLGAGVALLIASIHSMEEWVIVVSINQYFLAIAFGVIAGLVAEERVAAANRQMAWAGFVGVRR